MDVDHIPTYDLADALARRGRRYRIRPMVGETHAVIVTDQWTSDGSGPMEWVLRGQDWPGVYRAAIGAVESDMRRALVPVETPF